MIIAYGVWVEKSMFGKKYMGVERSTFVIDRDRRIAAIFRKVKPGEHVKQLRTVLLEPGSATPAKPEKDLPS